MTIKTYRAAEEKKDADSIEQQARNEEKKGNEAEKLDMEKVKTQEVLPTDLWAPCTIGKCLHIPASHAWPVGTEIKDDKGQVIFKIIREQVVGSNLVIGPIYQVIIGDAGGNMIAVVQRCEKPDSCGKDYFSIYALDGPPTSTPTDQKGTTPVLDVQGHFKAKIQQSVLGKKYKLYDDNDDVLLKAKNGNIRCALFFLPCLFCNPSWRLEFYKPGHSEDKVLVRDQGEGILTVAPGGQSPLMAICVAYAIDKFLTPWSMCCDM
jgi:hypothetical protein